jgi:cytochrome P450
LLTRLSYFVTDHKAAKMILGDTKTFQKQSVSFAGPAARFFGESNVLLVNGEVWQRQRKAMNPAFYDLEIYSQVFTEKAQKTVSNMMKHAKDGVIADIPDFMQKMTLDILGKAIFDHEFNSLDASEQKELEAYNFITDRVFNIKFIFANIILGKFDSLPFNTSMNKAIDKMDELVDSLIEKSINRVQSNGKMDSMLDFMIESHLNGDESNQMTRRELRGKGFQI